MITPYWFFNHTQRQAGYPPNRQPATVIEEERGGRGATSRRSPPTELHAPQPRTRTSHPLSDKTQSTAYTSTNDPHCRKPAHSLRRASTGGRPRLAAKARGRPQGDVHRQPCMSPQQWQDTRRRANCKLCPGMGKGVNAGAGPPRRATRTKAGIARDPPPPPPAPPQQPPMSRPHLTTTGWQEVDVLSSATGPSTV